TQNIFGNVQGDLMLDPSQLASVNPTVSPAASNLTVNSQATGQINNDVSLAAASGNATVSGNTSAGNATTGNAAAVADIVNVINSIISSGQSFMGTINIFGNLNGDILMPQDALSQLLASANAAPGSNTVANTGPASANGITNTAGNNTNVNNTSTS